MTPFLATYLLTYGFTTYLGPREADEDAILRRDGLVDGAPAAVEAARDDGAQPRHVDEARLAHAEALRDDLHLVRGAQVAVAARHHREVDLDRVRVRLRVRIRVRIRVSTSPRSRPG